MSSPQHLTPRIAFFLTLPPLLWAGNAVTGRLLVGTVPPMALSALRWAIALVLLLPFAMKLWRRPQDIRERWRYLALIGILGVGTYNSLQYLALQTPRRSTSRSSSRACRCGCWR